MKGRIFAIPVAVLLLTTGFIVGDAHQQPQPTPTPVVDTVRILLSVPGVCFLIANDSLVNNRTGQMMVAATHADLRVPCVPIVLNKVLLDSLPSELRLFVLLHELGHVHLGHGYPKPGEDASTPAFYLNREREADCQAAKWLYRDWRHEYPTVLALVAFGEGGEEYDVGVERVARMKLCAETP